MRWPWKKPAPVTWQQPVEQEPPKLTDVRHNGTYFEVLTAIVHEDGVAREVWDPYIDELMRWRYVETAPGEIAQPYTRVYDELVAEGWTPPGARDLPPALCLKRMVAHSYGDETLCICHMLAGHSGHHWDQVEGRRWG